MMTTHNQYEEALIIQRPDGVRCELVLQHFPAEAPRLVNAVFAPGADEPSQLIEMDMAELTARLNFMNQLKADGLL